MSSKQNVPFTDKMLLLEVVLCSGYLHICKMFSISNVPTYGLPSSAHVTQVFRKVIEVKFIQSSYSLDCYMWDAAARCLSDTFPPPPLIY